ncbi:peptide chain release factor 2 [Candidatus Gottesmanbacteria bacterium]|nr:peptide chain release factor 2 [Candidatus Gottesmanbacteria bacterium]
MEELKKRYQELVAELNLEEKKRKIEELELESSNPSFWQNPQAASKKMQELADLQKELAEIKKLQKFLNEGNEKEAEKILVDLEFKLFLSGPHDQDDAIVCLHAGQGGVEAMDWAEMVLRMYTRYIEDRGWKWEEIDRTPGDEAGVKSVTITINGSYAYGYLKGEAGVHRLVRQSPFNADRLRQTSFALVEVLPVIEETGVIEIKDEDLEWDFFRASSHGGQNVQKVSSAVRVKHKPTETIVTCQTERYQAQNRENALKILRAKLWALAEARTKMEEQKMKGEFKMASWGNQIRSYVLHPYHLVKDLRTGYETNNTEAVLNGKIEQFIRRGLFPKEKTSGASLLAS